MKYTLALLFILVTLTDVIGQGTQACTRTYTLDADFYEGQLLSVNTSVPNQLQLDQPGRPLPYINIACSQRGTVVRIDINTGQIIGEYLTAPSGRGANPSRTTVDKSGNVWVTNRDEAGVSGGFPKGSVTKIGITIGGIRCDANGLPNPSGQYLKPPFFYNTCVDRDGDGLIKTSRALGNILGWSNAGGVDDNGGVSTAEDEAITVYARVRAVGARTVAVDVNNNIWVGGSSNRFHEKINGITGQPFPGTLFNVGGGGYGGFIDDNGILWSSGAPTSGPLVRYNTVTGVTQTITGQGDYGLGVDPITGEIWHTNYQGGTICKMDLNGTLLGTYNHGYGFAQGCAVDAFGNVWVAHSLNGSTSVGHLRTDGTFIGNVELPSGGDGPTGVAVDANGKVWVTCYNSNQAMRIDPALGAVNNGFPEGAVDLIVDLGAGASPYNYSDMTGFVVINATVPSGTWTVIHDGQTSGAKWGRITWTDSIPAGTGIRVEARASDNLLTLATKQYSEVFNGESFCCAGVTGRYIEIRTTLFRSQAVNVSPILYDLTVACCDVYQSTPPTLTSSRRCGTLDTLKVAAGQPLTFTLTGNDVDPGQQITLTGNSLPAGSIMNPVLPAIGRPVQSTFVWNTSFSDVGIYNFSFEANDTYCYSASCPVVANVVPCPTIQCSGVGISCTGLCNGRATVTISGNPSNFTYLWNTSPPRTTSSISNLCPGTYKVITDDGFACRDSCTLVIPASPCDGFRSYTQGGYGATPKGKNPATYMRSKFASVFPAGLVVGCTNKLRLTTWSAVVDFLPSGSTARALPAGTLTNPGLSYQNVLAGQLVAATLNVKFDSADFAFAPSAQLLGDLVIASGTFSGWTVKQLLAEANKAIGGCGSSYSFSAITDALDKINNNYDSNGLTTSPASNRCFLSCPLNGTSGSLRLGRPLSTIEDIKDLEVFPNPAMDDVTIRFVSKADGYATIQLLSSNGTIIREVMNRSVDEEERVEEKVNTVGLTSGIYIVRFNDNTQQLYKRLVIIK